MSIAIPIVMALLVLDFLLLIRNWIYLRQRLRATDVIACRLFATVHNFFQEKHTPSEEMRFASEIGSIKHYDELGDYYLHLLDLTRWTFEQHYPGFSELETKYSGYRHKLV